jgi:Tfp pilus assembly protein PilX
MKSSSTVARSKGNARHTQQGISLIFALLALVVLTLGAVGVLRSTDTGVLALGNLNQKQRALVAAGRGAEDAMHWLKGNRASLSGSQAASGYVHFALANLDVTAVAAKTVHAKQLARVDWENDGCLVGGEAFDFSSCLDPTTAVTYGDIQVSSIIMRLCEPVGNGQEVCARPLEAGVAAVDIKNKCQYGASCEELNSAGTASPYYRIITRAKTQRGTVTYTETLVNF